MYLNFFAWSSQIVYILIRYNRVPMQYYWKWAENMIHLPVAWYLIWMSSLINKGNYINYNYIKINIKGYILLNLWKSWLPKQHEIRACTVLKSPWIRGKVLEFNFHVYHITVKSPKGIRIIWSYDSSKLARGPSLSISPSLSTTTTLCLLLTTKGIIEMKYIVL